MRGKQGSGKDWDHNGHEIPNSPEPKKPLGNISEHLKGNDIAEKEWNRIVENLDYISESDRGVLESHCEAYTMKSRAWKYINVSYGDDIDYDEFNTWRVVYDKAQATLKHTERQFGLGPYARSKINLPKTETEDKGEFD